MQHSLLRLPSDDIVLLPGSDWYDELVPSRNQKVIRIQKTHNQLSSNVHRLQSSDLTLEKMGRCSSCSVPTIYKNTIFTFGGKDKSSIVAKAQYFEIPQGEIGMVASSWKPLPSPSIGRIGHVSIALEDQNVIMLVGGIDSNSIPTSRVDILDMTIVEEIIANKK